MRYSKLTISRPIIETSESKRFTAKIEHHATKAFGHDRSANTREGDQEIVIGNPRFKMLTALEYCLLYRAGDNDPRNKASSASRAVDSLDRSTEYANGRQQLNRQYDGLDFSSLPLSSNSMTLGTKPGYKSGEYQILLQPDPELYESGFLVSEAQLFSSALRSSSPRFGYPETPLTPGIPLLKLDADVTSDERKIFFDSIHDDKVLPFSFRLGELKIDPRDERYPSDVV